MTAPAGRCGRCGELVLAGPDGFARPSRAAFAAEFGLRSRTWCPRNFWEMTNSTGLPPAEVATIRRLLAEIGAEVWRGKLLGYGLFEDAELWARGPRPVLLTSHPERIGPDVALVLAELRRVPELEVAIDPWPSWIAGRTLVGIGVPEPRRKFCPPTTVESLLARRAAFIARSRARRRRPYGSSRPENDARQADDHQTEGIHLPDAATRESGSLDLAAPADDRRGRERSMATLLLVRCDRCGERIEVGRTRLAVECGAGAPAWPTDPSDGRRALDLCPTCVKALAEWLAVPTGRPG